MEVGLVADAPWLMSADELAGELNVHPSTIRRLAAAGQLPALKVGAQWRFHVDAVQAALEERTMQSSALREMNAKIRARARERAERTLCFEIEGIPGSVVIVAHPGQSLEGNALANGFQDVHEFLLKNFGLVDPTKVKKLSDSWAAPPLTASSIDAEIAAAEADLAELRARKHEHDRIEGDLVANAEARVDELEAERASETKGARAKP